MQLPNAESVSAVLAGLLGEDQPVTLDESGGPALEELKSPYVSVCLGDDQQPVCAIIADLTAAVSLGGQLMMLPIPGLEDQIEENDPPRWSSRPVPRSSTTSPPRSTASKATRTSSRDRPSPSPTRLPKTSVSGWPAPASASTTRVTSAAAPAASSSSRSDPPRQLEHLKRRRHPHGTAAFFMYRRLPATMSVYRWLPANDVPEASCLRFPSHPRPSP